MGIGTMTNQITSIDNFAKIQTAIKNTNESLKTTQLRLATFNTRRIIIKKHANDGTYMDQYKFFNINKAIEFCRAVANDEQFDKHSTPNT